MILKFLVPVLMLTSCRTINSQENNLKIKDSILDIVKMIEYEYDNDIMLEKKYKNLKNDVFVEVLEDLDKNNRTYFYSYDDTRDNSNLQYKLFVNKNNILLMCVFEANSYDKINQTVNNEKKDTLYFKSNKIYFWKNKTPSKKEILAKESEILAIKREIDSVLNE